MKKLLLGTGNEAKLNLYKKLLKDLALEIVSSKELGIEEPQENEPNFEQQALVKAKYYYEKSGIPCLVDDGGFEIEALNGEPGVKSNRWVGHKMTDDEIIVEVIKRMEGVPAEKRGAKHTVFLALASPLGVFTAHGEVAGVVADKPSEKRIPNLPYRSVLYLPNYQKYWAELSEDESEILNHRKHALQSLKDIIKEVTN